MRSNLRGFIALSAALTATSTMATSAFAYDETGSVANANSAPVYRAVADRIAPVQNIAYPGTMKLEIDATDVDQSIFKVKQTIPVAKSGRITLLYPEWLPGNHAPRGEIEKLAGLKIMAGAMELPWDAGFWQCLRLSCQCPNRHKKHNS